jgi:hypothetical protein
MYSVEAPGELLTVTTRYAAAMVFYTDGSLIGGCAGFAFHRTGKGDLAIKYRVRLLFLLWSLLLCS